MSRSNGVRGITRALGRGFLDLPSNTAWVLAKAAAPATNATDALPAPSSVAGSLGSGVRRAASGTREAVADLVSGNDVDEVSTLAREAEEAAARAREAESHALELARAAKRRADEAAKVRRENAERLKGVEDEARKVQTEAGQAIASARAELDEARRLSAEAAKAARTFADRARRDAERIAERARERVAAVEETMGRVEASNGDTRTATRRTRTTRAGVRPDDLEELTKAELLRVASEIDLDGRSAMSKPELIDAITHEEVGLDNLTRSELLRVADHRHLPARRSMSKPELIDLVGSRSRGRG